MKQPAIIAPRVSKMSLLECLVDSHVVSSLDKILCVGDRGRIPGNGYQLLSPAFALKGENPVLDTIIDKYYDSDNETDSTKLGGTDLKYGFNGCGLPVASCGILVGNHGPTRNRTLRTRGESVSVGRWRRVAASGRNRKR